MRTGVPAVWLLGVATGLLVAQFLQDMRRAQEGADLVQYRAVRDFVRDTFVRPVDEQELLDASLHGMLDSLDTYSRYYDEPQSQVLDQETAGNYAGVGAVFRPLEGLRTVLFPLSDSPAERGGLRVGDAILAIDGEPALDLDDATFRARLVPDRGGPVALRVRGLDGTERTLEVTPGAVVDPSVRHARLLSTERAGRAGVGYLSIDSFTRRTADEYDAAVLHLRDQGATALVVDLRGNLGGVLESAVAIAQRHVPEGVIVTTAGRQEREVRVAEPERATLADLPVVVLVDGSSASASEVLAGALQDHRRAVVVGAPTYGKGMVQTIRRFPRAGTRAKVTSAYYYSPAGRNFERSATPGRTYGIEPDVDVELDETAVREVHQLLVNYGPPPGAVAALAAWEASSGLDLLPRIPDDAQLAAALALLRGERP